ncbi:MAG: hypothetical protein N4A70_17325 [Pelagimonas sp.]|jgi:hypothetical protein|nr:hypothetical protein [Pelagimonas sp.]
MKILAVGDSHTRRFTPGTNSRLDLPFELRVKGISGASAWGLAKGSGTTGADRKIQRNIRIAGPDLSHIVFCFGQVDVEAGFIFRRFVRQEELTFSEFCNMVVPRYLAYCKTYQDRAAVVIKGLNASALPNQDMTLRYLFRELRLKALGDDGIAAFDRLKAGLPDYAERAQMNLEYNARLEYECAKEGLPYFDINAGLVDGTGLIRDEFLGFDGSDNHVIESLAVSNLHMHALIELVQT